MLEVAELATETILAATLREEAASLTGALRV
jgi:hypothetical protein